MYICILIIFISGWIAHYITLQKGLTKTQNFWFSCLSFLMTGTPDMYHSAQQQMFPFLLWAIALIISLNQICYLFIFFSILNYFPKFNSVLSILNYIPDIENFMLWGFRLLILVGNEFGWTQNRSPSFGWQLKSQFRCFLLSWLKAPRCCGTGSPRDLLPLASPVLKNRFFC